MKNNATIYHNPRCSKSRKALEILQEQDLDVKIILYIKEPLTASELTALCDQIGIVPSELVRTHETLWKEQYKNKNLSEAQIVALLVKNPKLIARPIVSMNGKTIIALPPEKIMSI